MKTADIIALYGQPGNTSNFMRIKLPYPMRIAWDLGHTVTSILVHKKEAERILAIFSELLETYGLAKLQALGIDIFGGCYNFRKMRGGDDWSVHSWAIAIDLHPDKNRLEWKADLALFAKPEYKPMIHIFEKYGWHSLGKEKNYDYMHFQAVPC